jgi:hypothetical protein
MANNDNALARGIYYNEPRDGAPDYVIAALSFRRSDFIAWLQAQEEDAKGYIKVDILRAKSSGKIYGKLNEWKPKEQGEHSRRPEPRRNDRSHIPDANTQRVAEEFGGTVSDSEDVPF